MWILMLILLLLAAQLNVTALVPLQPGGTPPPWWVGGRLLWPFAVETHTLLPRGDLLNTLTPILAIASALCFLLAVVALLRWVVPGAWFPWLIVAGTVPEARKRSARSPRKAGIARLISCKQTCHRNNPSANSSRPFSSTTPTCTFSSIMRERARARGEKPWMEWR